jgi:hypothetical protein
MMVHPGLVILDMERNAGQIERLQVRSSLKK